MPKRRTKTKKGCNSLLNRSKKIFSNYTKLHNTYIAKLQNLKKRFDDNVDKTSTRVNKHMDKLDECLNLYPDIKKQVYVHFDEMKDHINHLRLTNHEIKYLRL